MSQLFKQLKQTQQKQSKQFDPLQLTAKSSHSSQPKALNHGKKRSIRMPEFFVIPFLFLSLAIGSSCLFLSVLSKKDNQTGKTFKEKQTLSQANRPYKENLPAQQISNKSVVVPTTVPASITKNATEDAVILHPELLPSKKRSLQNAHPHFDGMRELDESLLTFHFNTNPIELNKGQLRPEEPLHQNEMEHAFLHTIENLESKNTLWLSLLQKSFNKICHTWDKNMAEIRQSLGTYLPSSNLFNRSQSNTPLIQGNHSWICLLKEPSFIKQKIAQARPLLNTTIEKQKLWDYKIKRAEKELEKEKRRMAIRQAEAHNKKKLALNTPTETHTPHVDKGLQLKKETLSALRVINGATPSNGPFPVSTAPKKKEDPEKALLIKKALEELKITSIRVDGVRSKVKINGEVYYLQSAVSKAPPLKLLDIRANELIFCDENNQRYIKKLSSN